MSNPDTHFSEEELRDLLASIDHPVPPVDVHEVIMRARARSGWRSALLAAAAVLVVASAAAATVRSSFVAHLLDRMHTARSTAQSARTPSAVATGVAASRGIAFVPGMQVEVEFRAVQSSGELQVRWADASSVLLTQTGAEGDAHYALTPTGVIVDNARSAASYSLVLPRSVQRARVSIAGREVLAKNGETISCSGARDDRGICTIVLTAAGPR
jgi:hypothetical protein